MVRQTKSTFAGLRAIALLLAVTFTAFLAVTPALANTPPRTFIVIDAASGQVLFDEAPDLEIHPASLTKMMTLYLLFDALKSGRLKMSSRIKFSRKASRQTPSKLGVRAGRSISVRTAIQALAIKSANDVAVAVAERLGRTEKRFAEKMNAKARALGMSRTNFVNASGLHDPEQVSTARDMARLARGLRYKHRRYYKYFKAGSFRYAKRTYRGHNRFLKNYKGADGIKTGYIRASGFNLAASAVRGRKGKERRLIAVLIGGESSAERNLDMIGLMDAGYRAARSMKHRRYVGIAPLAHDWRRGGRAKPPKHRPGSKPARKNRAPLVASARRGGGKGGYAVQVGAVQNQRAALKLARKRMDQLGRIVGGGKPVTVPLARRSGQLHRARIAGLPEAQAANACVILKRAGHGCLVVAPAG
jgi:D-alanyl-D-alanine carboxypeptidase